MTSPFSYFKHRRFRADIITLFLAILLSTFICTIYVLKDKGEAIVLDFTDRIMRQLHARVEERMALLWNRMEEFSKLIGFSIPSEESITPKNNMLISSMKYSLQSVTDLTALFVAATNGSFLGHYRIDQPSAYYRNDPALPLPSNIVFATQYIDRTQTPAQETWYYQNDLGITVGEEKVKDIYYDPRKSIYFQGVVQNEQPFWTPAFFSGVWHQRAIAYARPVYDEKGTLFAVSGGEEELTFFSKFLQKYQIGPGSLIAMVHGSDLLTMGTNFTGSQLMHKRPIVEFSPLLAASYIEHIKTGKTTFLFSFESVSYICSWLDQKSPSGESWMLVMAVPEKLLLENVLSIERNFFIMILVFAFVAVVLATLSARRISRPILALADKIHTVQRMEDTKDVEVKGSIYEVRLMQEAIASLQKAMRSFISYVPKEIVQVLLVQEGGPSLEGEVKELSIFFSDIYNFTTISEKLSSQEVVLRLQEYFEAMSHVILQHQGTIDKYIGDSVMAFWGAPLDVPDHPYQACISALACQKAVSALNERWQKEGKEPFITRIGIHNGYVIVGNIGTNEHMNYTIIGDSVNAAASLEGINKIYHTGIIISEFVYLRVQDRFIARPLDIIKVKDKEQLMKIYELMAEAGGETTLAKKFTDAFTLYHEGKLQDAKKAFTELAAEYPNDGATQFYLTRLAEKESV